MTALAIWAVVRRFWPIPVAALALWLAYTFAYNRGHDSRNGEVAAITRENETLSANAITLDAALARQNAALADAGERARKAQQASREALARAVAADKAAASLRARAGKLAGAVTVGPCVSVEGDVLSKEAWGRL